MRWFSIREAKIDPALRQTFERVIALQSVLGANSLGIIPQGQDLSHNQDALLSWLTEQHDRKDRWETWSMTMAVAITHLVIMDVSLTTFGFWAVLIQTFQR
jgi:hypothetical protein